MDGGVSKNALLRKKSRRNPGFRFWTKILGRGASTSWSVFPLYGACFHYMEHVSTIWKRISTIWNAFPLFGFLFPLYGACFHYL